MSSSRDLNDAKDSIYHVDLSDPHGELVDRSDMSRETMDEINRLMTAMAALRRAEDELSDASARYMKLNKTDMRALHFLIVTQNRGELATPGEIAAHLGITTASTTKLLDRLERGGHITRERHPFDRRALVVRISPETRRSAMDTVGRQQAQRFVIAARRTPEERQAIISFLEETASELSVAGQGWSSE